jgi:uncharacterized membrane protein
VRGLLLIGLELTVVNWGWHFDEQPGFYLLQVIWALGWSMVALAGLVWLPLWAVGVFGLAMIAGHNLLDGVGAATLGLPGWLWTLLHNPGGLRVAGREVFALYPLIPWVGVMAAGYALGPLLRRQGSERRRWLAGLGLGLSLGFVLVRLINRYGDPFPWTPQAHPLYTLFSFLNAEKYPPSLAFLLMTLGPALLVLAWLDRAPGPVGGPVGGVLATYGRVPLFFYLLHLPLIHALARFGFGGQRFDLPVVYGVWAGVVAALYLPCRYLAALKSRRQESFWKYW